MSDEDKKSVLPEMAERRFKEQATAWFGSGIKSWLPVIVVLVGVVLYSANLSTRVVVAEEAVDKIEARVGNIETMPGVDLGPIETRVAVQEANTTSINKRLDSIDTRLDRIEDKIDILIDKLP